MASDEVGDPGLVRVDRYEATLAMHTVARHALTGLVRYLPARATDPLRRQVSTPARSRRQRASSLFVAVLRHGGIPTRVKTFTLADNGRLSLNNADSLVIRQLYWFGETGWEPELMPAWRYFCSHASSILEIGANVGYYTVQGALAAPRTKYVAVEPHPVAARNCQANLDLNHVTSVRLVRAAAVSQRDTTTVQLHVPRKDHFAAPAGGFVGGSTEIPPSLAHHIADVIEAPAVDVRSLLKGVDLMKLDVEGFEHALLSAAVDHLRVQHPTVVVEVLGGTRKLRDLLRSLCDESGYRFYVPSARGLVELESGRIGDVALQRDFGTRDAIMSYAPIPGYLLVS